MDCPQARSWDDKTSCQVRREKKIEKKIEKNGRFKKTCKLRSHELSM